MNPFLRIAFWSLVLSVMCSACSYQRQVQMKRTDLPEYIYRTPIKNDYMASSVGVFAFREPPYAAGTGDVAAELLYDEVLSSRVFAVVAYEPGLHGMTPETLRGIAKAKGYDLMITGDIAYYFEGSDHHAARVDERMRVLDVQTNKTLWYAKAVDIGPNAPLLDLAVVQGYGAPAPSTRTLFKRNAEKFARLLLNRPTQKLWTGDNAEARGDESWGQEMEEDLTETRPFLNVPFDTPPFVMSEREDDPVIGLDEPDASPRASAPQEEAMSAPPQPTQLQPQNEMPELERQEPVSLFNKPVYFDLDDSTLQPEAKKILKTMAAWLQAHPEAAIEIQGHCDERGTESYNMALGEKRAWNAKRHLVDLGISTQRLGTASFGKEKPIDPAHNEKAWDRNRRAEFVIVDQ